MCSSDLSEKGVSAAASAVMEQYAADITAIPGTHDATSKGVIARYMSVEDADRLDPLIKRMNQVIAELRALPPV